MRFIRDIHGLRRPKQRPVISFEFSPPKTDEGDRTLFEKTLPALAELKPDYCSVTYGAGGSTKAKTLDIVERMQRELKLVTMSHLTCVGATREEISSVLDDAARRGIQNILALRGDPPGGLGAFAKTKGGFEFSNELVAFIKARNQFCIGAAGFPEGHMHCKEGKFVDWDHLKRKIDAGAEFILTQLFFDNHDFFEFQNHMIGTLGVKVPICPGILPIPSVSWIKRFIPLCGARVPKIVEQKLAQFGDNEEGVVEWGIEYATKQCEELLKFDVPGLHFYTVNKVKPTKSIMLNLGL
ncbi:MAG TPA: methylenetetrahydrofolate reductase [NAD(P)H] [Planctomycetota bacterium]|nr:methylenetetrahydrofolate reductase [NAD(P)H] [Planctomycetota bacterium]